MGTAQLCLLANCKLDNSREPAGSQIPRLRIDLSGQFVLVHQSGLLLLHGASFVFVVSAPPPKCMRLIPDDVSIPDVLVALLDTAFVRNLYSGENAVVPNAVV